MEDPFRPGVGIVVEANDPSTPGVPGTRVGRPAFARGGAEAEAVPSKHGVANLTPLRNYPIVGQDSTVVQDADKFFGKALPLTPTTQCLVL